MQRPTAKRLCSLKDGTVVGIFGRNEKNEQVEIGAKLVVDALGVASMLRRRLPENPYIGKDVSTDDIESTGRYIVSFESEREDLRYYDPKNALIHLNQELAPGGYGWVFPKTGLLSINPSPSNMNLCSISGLNA